MAQEWTALVKEVAPAYLKNAADNTIRDRLLLMLLARSGRIKYGMAGSHKQYWDVKAAQRPIVSYGDDGVITFTRHDLYEQLNNDWRGYKMPDKMTEKERLMSGSNWDLVNRYSQRGEDMLNDLQDGFCGELFIDGTAAGAENKLIGLQSFLKNESGGVAVGDRVAQPSLTATYGGYSIKLGNRGGTWSSDLGAAGETGRPNDTIANDWPAGSGDAEYDFNTPKLINAGSTSWDGSSNSWADNCERVLDRAIIWMTQTGGKRGRPTIFLLNGEWYGQYQTKTRDKYRIHLPHQEGLNLGFPDALTHSGVAVQPDFDVPATKGFGINVNQMCIESLYSSLFSSEGPERDMSHDAWLWLMGFFGNARFNVKHFCDIQEYATA